MLKITIISVGGMKESYFAEAIAEYEKRASAYAELKNINLKEAPLDRVREGDIAAALDAACEVAERAAHATITMQARKGRASYLGERSLGHQDPGATSFTTMLKVAAAHV